MVTGRVSQIAGSRLLDLAQNRRSRFFASAWVAEDLRHPPAILTRSQAQRIKSRQNIGTPVNCFLLSFTPEMERSATHSRVGMSASGPIRIGPNSSSAWVPSEVEVHQPVNPSTRQPVNPSSKVTVSSFTATSRQGRFPTRHSADPPCHVARWPLSTVSGLPALGLPSGFHGNCGVPVHTGLRAIGSRHGFGKAQPRMERCCRNQPTLRAGYHENIPCGTGGQLPTPRPGSV